MPEYEVRLSRPAQRDLDRLTRDSWVRIRDALLSLADDPRPPGCRKLRGGNATYRVRVGDYRALYDVDDDSCIVLVLRIRHRREVYR